MLQRQPSSLRELVGSDSAMAKVLAFLGAVGEEDEDWLSLADALAHGRLAPGVQVENCVKVGPAGAALLAKDACLGGLRLAPGSSWPAMFDALKVNTGLRKLVLRDCQPGSADVGLLAEALAVNSSLAELDLGSNDGIGEEGGRALAMALESNATLRVLMLTDTRVGDIGGAVLGAALATNVGLQELDLRDSGCGEATWHALATALTTNATLQKLDLSWTEPGDVGASDLFEAIVGNQALQELNVANCWLSKACGVALAEVVRANCTLQVLDVTMNWFGGNHDGPGSSSWPQVLEALKDNVGLRTLRLGGSGLTPANGQALAKALMQRPNGVLRELHLDTDELGDAACSAIVAACLQPGSALRKLKMRKTGFGRVAARCLGGLLRANGSLQVLDLSFNAFDVDNTWPEVVAALKHNVGLQKLHLYRCGLTADEGQALAKALLQRPGGVLRTLDLGGNANMGDANCCAIVTAYLQPGSALRELNMNDTGMERAAAHALAEGLRGNNSLEVLDISCNDLGWKEDEKKVESCWPELSAALAVNTGLRVLRMLNCKLVNGNIDWLVLALQTNRALRELEVDFGDDEDGDSALVLATGLATSTALRMLLLWSSLSDDALAAFTRLLRAETTLRELGIVEGWEREEEGLEEAIEQAGRLAGCSIKYLHY